MLFIFPGQCILACCIFFSWNACVALTLSINMTYILVSFETDCNQNLDLQLGMAPPSFSNVGKENNTDASSFHLQSGWDEMPFDRRPRVMLTRIC